MADLPKTPQAAPPNFYSQAAAMGGSKKSAKPTSGSDQEFLQNVTKLLSVLQKLGKSKPKGKDITKYTQAAADSMEEMLKEVYGEEQEQVPGSDTQAGDSGSDAGSGGGAAGAGPGAPGVS